MSPNHCDWQEMGSAPAEGKRVHLNFFETACRGNHEYSGQWARPGDNSCTKDSLDYYINMAKLAEKAKISAIFFADTYAGHAVYGGNMDAILRSGTQAAQLDPLVIISAMAVSIQSNCCLSDRLSNMLCRLSRSQSHSGSLEARATFRRSLWLEHSALSTTSRKVAYPGTSLPAGLKPPQMRLERTWCRMTNATRSPRSIWKWSTAFGMARGLTIL